MAAVPPSPVKTTPAVPPEVPAGKVVEGVAEDEVVVLTLVGF